MKIVTYTPNPAIDSWAACDEVVPTEKTRVSEVRYDPGGGGINVARVLATLGTPAEPVYLAGGGTRRLFEDLLAATGVRGTCVPIAGDTRISYVALERRTGREFRFVAEGPEVGPEEERRALDLLAVRHADWVVASGSLPRGLGPDHYVRVARIARAAGGSFALDASGEALRCAVEAGCVDLLKASRKELESLVGASLPTSAALEQAALDLVGSGKVHRVLVSLGPDGALLAAPGGTVTVPAPRLTVRGTVGAGDSFLAGFLHGLALGLTGEDALAVAVAAGSAACLHPGTQLVRLDDLHHLLGWKPEDRRPAAPPRPDTPSPSEGDTAMTQHDAFRLTGPAPGRLAAVVAAWASSRRGETPLPFADDIDPKAWPDPDAVALVGVFLNPLRLRLDRVGAEWTARFGRAVEGRFLDEIAGRDPFDGIEQQALAAIETRSPTLSQAEGRPARLILPYWGDGHVSALLAVLDRA